MEVEREARFGWKKENLLSEEMNAKDIREKIDSLFGEAVSPGAGMSAELTAHEGVFESPGYARMTISVAHRRRKDEKRAEPYLLVTPSPRGWDFLLELMHIHDEIFMGKTIRPYPEGEADSNAGPGQIQNQSRALFKLGKIGKVQSVGIELEPAMVAVASKGTEYTGEAESGGVDVKIREGAGEDENKEGGEKPWGHDWDAIEKGMIWFERIDDGS